MPDTKHPATERMTRLESAVASLTNDVSGIAVSVKETAAAMNQLSSIVGDMKSREGKVAWPILFTVLTSVVGTAVASSSIFFAPLQLKQDALRSEFELKSAATTERITALEQDGSAPLRERLVRMDVELANVAATVKERGAVLLDLQLHRARTEGRAP